MFGYIDIDKDIDKGAKGLNQTFMCGLCVSTKKLFGNLPRMAVNNDINFFNVLFHSYLGADVAIDKSRCVASPIRQRTIIDTDVTTDRLAIANVMLIYLNMYDDIVDGTASAKKKIAIRAYGATYRKAVKLWPEMNSMMTGYYQQLRQLECDGETSIDKVCHPFAQLSRQMADMVLDNANTRILDLCYNIAKWIYLIDALDDICQDARKGSYNLYLTVYGNNNPQVVSEHIDEINFVLYSTLNSIAIAYNDLQLAQYRCILDSIIYQYIRNRTQQLLDKLCKEKQ